MERPRPPFSARIVAGVSLLGIAMFACDGQDKPGPVSRNIPTESPVAASGVPAVKTLQPPEKPTPIAKTVIPENPKPSVTPRHTASVNATENMAVRINPQFRVRKAGIEVVNSESLDSLSEFTIIARIKVNDSLPSAIASKGDKVEAYAFFAKSLNCFGKMAVVIDDRHFCSDIGIENNQPVNVAVTYKDNEAYFFANDVKSNRVPITAKIPEKAGGSFVEGFSQKGLNQQLDGEIDFLALVARRMSDDEIKSGLNSLRSNDVQGFMSKAGDVRLLHLFNGDYKDYSGKGNNGIPVGAVSLVAVN